MRIGCLRQQAPAEECRSRGERSIAMAEKISFTSADNLRKFRSTNKNPGLHRRFPSTSLAREALRVVPELDGVPPRDAAVDPWEEHADEDRPSTPLPPRFEDTKASPDDSWSSVKRRRLTNGGYALNLATCSEHIARCSQTSWPGETSASDLREHGPSAPSIMQTCRVFELACGPDCGASVSRSFASRHIGGASSITDGCPNPSILQPLKTFESAVEVMFRENGDVLGNEQEHDPLELNTQESDEDMDF